MKNKKLIIIGIAVITVCIISGLFLFSKPSNDVHNLYNDVLEELLGNTDYSQYNFALTHIDEDDTYELIVGTSTSITSMIEIYTIHDNQVYNLGRFGSEGTIRCTYKDNIIVSQMYDYGSYYSTYYSISEGEAIFKDEVCTTKDLTYTINNQSVSEQEYIEFTSSYSKDKTWLEISADELVHLNASTLEAFKENYELFVYQ